MQVASYVSTGLCIYVFTEYSLRGYTVRRSVTNEHTKYNPKDLASSITYRTACWTLHKGHGTSVCLRASGWFNMQFANLLKTYDIDKRT